MTRIEPCESNRPTPSASSSLSIRVSIRCLLNSSLALRLPMIPPSGYLNYLLSVADDSSIRLFLIIYYLLPMIHPSGYLNYLSSVADDSSIGYLNYLSSVDFHQATSYH